MSSDDYEKRLAKCIKDYEVISRQFPVLLQKMEALDPPKKKKPRRSAKKKSEAEEKPASPDRAAYADLAVTIRGFLKELGEDVDEDGGAAAPAPPAAAGDK